MEVNRRRAHTSLNTSSPVAAAWARRQRWIFSRSLELAGPARAGTARDSRHPPGAHAGFIAWKLLACALALFQADVNAAAHERSSTAPRPRLSIRWVTNPSRTNKVAVEVTGLSPATLQRLQQSDWKPEQWPRLLSIYAEQEDSPAGAGLPPMFGDYRVQSGALRFEPQFPLEPGVKYRAIFYPDQLPGQRGSRGEPITNVFQVPPRPSSPTARVSRVYPSAAVLPENLLKFYIHFSAPMSRGRIYEHIHLRDDTGKEVRLPFLEIDEELWDPTMTRLTLLIDPGRIKRGVRPLEEVGPALEDGKGYTLVIDQAWRDGTGNPLKETFQKVFKVGPADRDPPNPAGWKIRSPKSQTRDVLTMTFPEPMDHALAQRVIQVVNDSGERVPGKIALEDEERRWMFAPTQPWRSGPYRVVIPTTIEDLAGNNIGKPFDVDLFENAPPRLAGSTVKLSFEVR